MSLDLAVIGGGIIGLTTAWRLAQAGLSVAVFERGKAGRQASWAAGGMLAPSAEAQFGEDALVELGRRSVERYPSFIEELEDLTGHPTGYVPRGTLVVAVDRDDVAALNHVRAFQEAVGLPVTWLRPSAVREREPYLSPRLRGALYSPIDHRVDNRALVTALAGALTLSGGILHENAPCGLWMEEGRARGVIRLDEEGNALEHISAHHVLLAAGAWSAQTAGLPEDWKLPVRPVKGQMLAVQSEQGITLNDTVRTPRVYLIPRENGRIVVGATSEEQGFDARLTAGGLYHLLEHAYEVFPAIAELPVLETWVGFRPGSRDNLPLLGPTRIPGLILATGHYRAGILLAPVTADLLLDYLLEDRLTPLAPFSPSRLGL